MAEGDTFGSELNFNAGDPATGAASNFGETPSDAGPSEPPAMAAGPAPAPSSDFGSMLRQGWGAPRYSTDPQADALDQSASLLQQRVKRATEISNNPLAAFFNPEAVQKAREFVPQATEQLLKIQQQKAGIAAGKQQADSLGLAPGEVSDQATQADRVEVAKNKALKGDLNTFKGLQAVDPKAAEAIQDQVHEAVAGHLTNAQYAFDSLAGMQNQGQYAAKLAELRQKGTLTDLEALGLKVPPSFDQFSASKSREGQALREARIGVDTVRQKLEERNTYQPMEKKEAETYNGRMTTAYGDQVTNGTWGRNGASGVRGLIVNGAADPRDLGKNFTLASPDQRKELSEAGKLAVPKEDVEKYRAFNRTYELATKDDKGNPLPEGKINTNPNVQQGVAEGLASMLRGGAGGANVGLLKIELAKRGWAQGAIDGLVSNYAGAMNTLFDSANKKDYQSANTQKQIRDVMDVLKTYTGGDISNRIGSLAERAGALGLDRTVFGLGSKESGGVIDDAIERGRQAQIARMLPTHQAIGGGDGVFQLGAQRPGSGATAMNPGTTPATQLPGAAPLATPVQQAINPPVRPAPAPLSPNPALPGSGGGGGAPITIAGQTVTPPALPPGASPDYLTKMQRIESGNEKDPWKAGTPKSSASGAFQFINSTWAADKPPGAPARAGDATPQQQAEAAAARTTKNAAALQAAGVPVNDTNLYIAHNLGEGNGPKLLTADLNADARSIVGEAAARNNPLFFKGRPTVATVLARYNAEMNPPDDTEPKPQPGAGGATAEAPGLLTRVSRALSQGVPGGDAAKDKAVADVGAAATEHAPAIAGTVGAVTGGPVGGVVGGSAGQALKDYLQGNAQSPAKIAEEGALSGVLGVASKARPLLAAAGRVLGVGGVEAGAEAAKGGDAADIAEAGLKGGAAAAGGELFGRALGMTMHKVWTWLSPDGKAALQSAAKDYHEASKTLAETEPKVAGAGGASTPNPVYEAAQAAKDKAEQTLKDIAPNLKPEEAAYAHEVTAQGVPKQEAQVSKPGALEQQRVGQGYQQLESEVGAAGKGAVKPTPKLLDGPLAAVENKQVSKDHAELAQRVETAITAPAKSWQEKWVQLKDARSDLLTAERDALASTAPGKTQIAKDMRTLADTVRKQQEKAANYVFGPKDGPAFMDRLKVLDVRYRNLMEATNGGDLARAANMTGEAGRDADRKFRAFAHDDPVALAAWDAMRRTASKSGNVEKDVRTLVGAEKIPVLGHVISAAKLLSGYAEWMRGRVAGSPATFADMVPELKAAEQRTARRVRDIAGTIGARAAVQ